MVMVQSCEMKWSAASRRPNQCQATPLASHLLTPVAQLSLENEMSNPMSQVGSAHAGEWTSTEWLVPRSPRSLDNNTAKCHTC